MNDYIKDGLTYCGYCNTPKECVVSIRGKALKVNCYCECEKARKKEKEQKIKEHERMISINRLREIGFPDAEMRQFVFDKDDMANEKISRVARNYVENFMEMKASGKGLLFYGAVGTGKTFISACIANALIDGGHPCLVTNFARLCNTLAGEFKWIQKNIDNLNTYDLLVIDDLAAERDTEYMSEFVQNIIDARYRAKLPLIITTNLTGQELKNPADMKKQRTYSRLFEMCIPVEVIGQDRRKEKLKHDYDSMAELLGLKGV